MMFEFTEDKKGIRPKYIGTIKSNYIRRTLMILFFPVLLITVCLVNILRASIWILIILWNNVIYGLPKLIITSTFKKWDCWDEPRKKRGE